MKKNILSKNLILTLSLIFILISVYLISPLRNVSADTINEQSETFTVQDAADCIKPVGAYNGYSAARAAVDQYYVGATCYVFVYEPYDVGILGEEGSLFLPEDYEYGYFYAPYSSYIKSLELSSEPDHIKRFENLNLSYVSLIETSGFLVSSLYQAYTSFGYLYYEDGKYETPPNTTLEERKELELFVCMYVKDTSTGEIAYSAPLAASYANGEIEVATEITDNENADKNIENNNDLKIILGAAGVAVLLCIILLVISTLKRGKKKYK